MKQGRISVMENVNYSSFSLSTLRRIAEAYDLTLNVSFEEFGKRLVDIDRFSRESLQRRSFDEDPVFWNSKWTKKEEWMRISYESETAAIAAASRADDKGIVDLDAYRKAANARARQDEALKENIPSIMTGQIIGNRPLPKVMDGR